MAAVYNSASSDLGGWVEKIKPGAFNRALAEKQDVRHLKNHDANLVLGRTRSGTTTLTDSAEGLQFRTKLPNTSYAEDLAVSVERGDIDECSFGFMVHGSAGQTWADENGVTMRYLNDVDLLDISTVTYPAYPGTSAGVAVRSMFPLGVPAEVRSHMKIEAANGNDCNCDCTYCVSGVCSACSQDNCSDSNCEDCPQQQTVDDKTPAPAAETVTLAQAEGLLADERKAVKEIVTASVAIKHEAPRAAAEGDDGVLELFAYGDIGESWYGDGVTANGFRSAVKMAAPHSKIRVRINSFGGDAFEGIAIHNFLKSQNKPIEVFVDGIAASAASIVAMAGDTVTMGANTMMMVHNASCMAYGYASDLRKNADVLDKISAAIAQTYVTKTGMAIDKVVELMDNETWMTAEDAVRDGFANGIGSVANDDDANDDIADNSLAIRSYRNLPETLKLETRATRGVARAEKRSLEAEAIERDLLSVRRRLALASID